ncbi:MAG: alpha/beta hydrolase [Simkaniaceae bacterium]|nr:alpha/beta hydrolase [Simkaniaceae bacterium]
MKMSFLGPPLSEGKLPAILYLSLSDTDSLYLDPFNQFPKFLESNERRIFSFMIPGHEPGRKKEAAIKYWASEFAAGRDPITPFIEEALETIDDLLATSCSSIAIAGLSRGAFLATHIAARHNKIDTILGFAPLISLPNAKELKDLTCLDHLCLERHLDTLCKKKIRYTIGNRDLRVGTKCVFDFVTTLVETAYNHRVRSPPIELLITASIGLHGHGTPPETFKQGAEWIVNA